MNIRINTYSTVTALGADAVCSGGFLYLKGFEPMLIKGIKPTSVIAPVTEVLQVWTGTPTAANSTGYQISITYTNKVTNLISTWISNIYTSDATATATEIVTNMKAQVNAMSATMPVVATGTTTLVLTAVAGYAVFTAQDLGTGAIAFVSSPAGVSAVGKGSDLKNGAFYDSNLVDASYYAQVIINYNNRQNQGTSQTSTQLVNKSVLYVLNGSDPTSAPTTANYITLLGTYGTLTQALVGKAATWILQTNAGTHTAIAGTITLVGGDKFFAAAPTAPLVPGDVLSASSATALTSAGYPIVGSILTDATAASPTAGTITFAANVAHYVQLRAA